MPMESLTMRPRIPNPGHDAFAFHPHRLFDAPTSARSSSVGIASHRLPTSTPSPFERCSACGSATPDTYEELV
jgi:hypothetical protein